MRAQQRSFVEDGFHFQPGARGTSTRVWDVSYEGEHVASIVAPVSAPRSVIVDIALRVACELA